MYSARQAVPGYWLFIRDTQALATRPASAWQKTAYNGSPIVVVDRLNTTVLMKWVTTCAVPQLIIDNEGKNVHCVVHDVLVLYVKRCSEFHAGSSSPRSHHPRL